MPKSSFFTGQPIFCQLLKLIPKTLVSRLVAKHKADHYCKRFHSYDHLVTMLFSSFNKCNSLREVITGMQANMGRLHHLSITNTPRRSTLADANERRSAKLFEDLYSELYKIYYGVLPDSRYQFDLLDKLFIIDSSIITLFSNVMQSTGAYPSTGRKKGGLKVHTLFSAKDNVPAAIRLTEGKVSDPSYMTEHRLPAGSIIVMDKAYRNYEQYRLWTQNEITWVTRLHGRSVYTVIERNEVSEKQRQLGIQKDLKIELGGPKSIKGTVQSRLVVFKDKSTGEEFEFISNNMVLPAETIADIYKHRWNIELFFKRLKQNMQLHAFLGDNENAIKIQVWCALIADLLISIVKRSVEKKRKWSFSNLASLIRLHLTTYIDLRKFLEHPEKALLNYRSPEITNQLYLFSG